MVRQATRPTRLQPHDSSIAQRDHRLISAHGLGGPPRDLPGDLLALRRPAVSPHTNEKGKRRGQHIAGLIEPLRGNPWAIESTGGDHFGPRALVESPGRYNNAIAKIRRRAAPKTEAVSDAAKTKKDQKRRCSKNSSGPKECIIPTVPQLTSSTQRMENQPCDEMRT